MPTLLDVPAAPAYVPSTASPSTSPPSAAPSTTAPSTSVTTASNATLPPPADATAHIIRLCLDLQLDAMLLALGTSATRTAPGGPAAEGTVSTWQRWMLEDLQMVRSLAADVVRGGATLPTALGADPAPAARATVGQLAARYESMATLLAGILDTPPRAGLSGAVTDVAHDALTRCRRRLGELAEAERSDDSACEDSLGTGAIPPAAPNGLHRYLPGELLG